MGLEEGFYDIVTGTNLGGSEGFFPGTGTVTGWELGLSEILPNPSDPFHPIMQNDSYWTFTGLSVPAADFADAIQGDGATLAAYMPTMLAGNDTISGSAYVDYLIGYGGNDAIYGNGGNDTLEGRGGTDVLNGGLGADKMIGGLGNDTYIVDNVGDKTVEISGQGTDIAKASISWTLGAYVENLTLTGTAAINGTGNTLANTITGNSAANTLSGAGAADKLSGAGGNDLLDGGVGNDMLTGGAGQDSFLFDTTLNGATNVDKILDYTVGTDQIVLDNHIFTAFTAIGGIGASAFHEGTSAGDADDHIIYDSASGNIYYDPDGTGAAGQVLFAHVTPATALTSADFLVIT
jgi:Ca2+-binding RTX toxin-like protein